METRSEQIELVPFDPQKDREQLSRQLQQSKEVDDLTSTLEVYNLDTILSFGADASREISKASGEVLASMEKTSRNDHSADMMNALADVMSRFDADEWKEKSRIFGRLMKNSNLDRLLSKYHSLNDEIERIYVGLRSYEEDVIESSHMLQTLLEANIGYYRQLVKYTVAGKQGCKEIREYRDQQQKEHERTGDPTIQFDIISLNTALDMLEKKTQDLQVAEVVAIQSITMIQTILVNNANLIRKIDSAFLVTLPVFKQALAQSILLKRQEIQNQALDALEKQTREMVQRNAVYAARASAANEREISLEESASVIRNGLKDVRSIQQNAREQQDKSARKLAEIREKILPS